GIRERHDLPVGTQHGQNDSIAGPAACAVPKARQARVRDTDVERDRIGWRAALWAGADREVDLENRRARDLPPPTAQRDRARVGPRGESCEHVSLLLAAPMVGSLRQQEEIV